MKFRNILHNVAAVLIAVSLTSAVVAQTVDPATDPQIDLQIRGFLKALNSGTGKPIEQLSPLEARAVLTGAQKSVAVDYSGITVTEKTITQDGITVKIDIVKPLNSKGELPVFMFFHGGGWVLGDFPTHKRMIRDLVVESGAAAVYAARCEWGADRSSHAL